MTLNHDQLDNYHYQLIGLIKDFTGKDFTDTKLLFTDKNRLYPSCAIQDIKKIAYFTDQKLKDLKEKDYDEIKRLYGSSSYFNPLMREKNCIMIKAGKFFKYLLPDISDNEIKDMVSKWYSIVRVDIDSEWSLSIEKDIVKFYHEDQYYAHKGSLGSSCMRYDYCQEYIKFYLNYDVSLLVLKNNEDKIKARALIWHNVFFPYLDKKTDFIDRVYVNNDNDFQVFYDYAKENNFVYRKGYENFNYSGNSFHDTVIIKPLKKSYPETFPYCDTFNCMDNENNLSNDSDSGFYIELSSTDGDNSEQNNVSCESCGNVFNPDNEGIYVDSMGYICDSCASDYHTCYHCNETMHYDNGSMIHDEFICQSCIDYDYFQCENCGEYHHNDNSIEQDGQYYCNDCFYDLFDTCEDCGNTFDQDNLTNGYCPKCLELHTCEACLEVYNNIDNCICENCLNDMQEIEEKEVI